MSEDQDRGTEAVAESTAHPGTPSGIEPAPDQSGMGDTAMPQSNEDQARTESGRAEAELAELRDRLVRHQADFENFRRRTERERSEWMQFAGMEVVRSLLPALDDFERALRMTSEARAGQEPDEFQKGMDLVWQRLSGVLEKAGLEPIVAAGQSFDPQVHEAIDRTEDPDVDEDTVVAEYQRGYRFRGKLLRPALVKVAVKG